MYESDITRFLQELKKQRPDVEQGQIDGRALLWDRPQDPESALRHRESRVPPQPYVYYPKDYT